MKSTLITIVGLSAISYSVPASLEELQKLVSEDKTKADEQILNAANQYYLQNNLLTVRKKIVERLSKDYQVQPRIFAGKVEVTAEVDADGKISGYKAVTGNKKFKSDDKTIKKESANDFIARVVKEKEIPETALRSIVQEVATANGFSAEQKRVRGGVASKPVGAKWVALAEKIIAAGNGEKAAANVAAKIGQPVVDTTASDGARRLALALSEEAKQAAKKQQEELALLVGGTEEAPLVVDGTQS